MPLRKTQFLATEDGQIIGVIPSTDILPIAEQDLRVVEKGLQNLEKKIDGKGPYKLHKRGGHACLNVGIGKGPGLTVSVPPFVPTNLIFV